MKKWVILASAALLLSACGSNAEDADNSKEPENGAVTEEIEADQGEVSGENTSTETVDTAQNTLSIQELREQVEVHIDEGNLDEASYIISTYERKNRGEVVAEEATTLSELKGRINEEKASQTQTIQTSQPTDFQEVRESTVLNGKYEAENETALSEASDEEIAAWIEQKDRPNTPAETSSNQEDKAASSEEANNTDDLIFQAPSEDISEQSVMGVEEYALNQVTEQTGLLSEDYTYFSTAEEDGWVRVEMRESQTDGTTTWTNLIGLYRYNVETDQLESLNISTGKFE